MKTTATRSCFCRLFDFNAEIDGFSTYSVVPSGTGDEVPGYIGGEFSLDDYSVSMPDNFVWVAFDELQNLCEEYNDEHNALTDKYGVFADIDDKGMEYLGGTMVDPPESIHKGTANPVSHATHDVYVLGREAIDAEDAAKDEAEAQGEELDPDDDYELATFVNDQRDKAQKIADATIS